MLGKQLNGLKLALAPRTVPVGLELGSVQARPLGNERLCPTRQQTCDYGAVQIRRSSAWQWEQLSQYLTPSISVITMACAPG